MQNVQLWDTCLTRFALNSSFSSFPSLPQGETYRAVQERFLLNMRPSIWTFKRGKGGKREISRPVLSPDPCLQTTRNVDPQGGSGELGHRGSWGSATFRTTGTLPLPYVPCFLMIRTVDTQGGELGSGGTWGSTTFRITGTVRFHYVPCSHCRY